MKKIEILVLYARGNNSDTDENAVIDSYTVEVDDSGNVNEQSLDSNLKKYSDDQSKHEGDGLQPSVIGCSNASVKEKFKRSTAKLRA